MLTSARDLKITAWVPERFCSVDVEAKGPAASVNASQCSCTGSLMDMMPQSPSGPTDKPTPA